MESPLLRTLSVFGFIITIVITIGCFLHYSQKSDFSSLYPFVSRAEWLANPPNSSPSSLTIRPPTYVIISHTASGFCYDIDKCIQHVQWIQKFHMESRGWNDIAYNFLIGGDGAIYEGRGWDVGGSHTLNYNSQSIGISFIGTFHKQEPTESQIQAAKALIGYGLQHKKIAKDYILLGHRQCSEKSDSPGEKLYNIIKTWPHWSSTPNEQVQVDRIYNPLIPGVTYVNRTEWNAQPTDTHGKKLTEYPPSYVIISHTAMDSCYNRNECIRHVRFIQNFHVKSQGWDDIAYNFLVGGDGAIYEGRGWDMEGAHTFNYNKKSIGISFMGTFTKQEPTAKQIHAAKKLIEYASQTGKLAKNYKLLGHRQCIKTESPGEKLYQIIKTWPHWSPTP